jgi:hypothetical protein
MVELANLLDWTRSKQDITREYGRIKLTQDKGRNVHYGFGTTFAHCISSAWKTARLTELGLEVGDLLCLQETFG